MITFKISGDFSKTESFLRRKYNIKSILDRYGSLGVQALKTNTPLDTGETAEAWKYEIIKDNRGYKLIWTNDHIVNGIPVVILLQYGHGTTGGTFVEGRDFINPAMKPIFEKISEELWKEING